MNIVLELVLFLIYVKLIAIHTLTIFQGLGLYHCMP